MYTNKIDYKKISEIVLLRATNELINTLEEIGIEQFDIDNIGEHNKEIFQYEETVYETESVYRALSLLCVSLMDLGLIEIES